MKILHIDQHYEFKGGTEQYLLSVMAFLEQKGHEQCIVYGKRSKATLRSTERKSYYLPEITTELHNEELPALQKIIKNENPDIIYLHNVHNISAVELCSALKPTIRYIHDPSLTCFTHWKLLPPDLTNICTNRLGLSCFTKGCLTFSPKGLKRFFTRKREIKIHQKLATIIVASNYMKKLLIQNGIPEKKISIIPYFVTSPPERNDTKPADNEVPSLFYAGIMHRVKGVDLLLHALAELQDDFKASFAGVGEQLEEYKALAEKLGISKKLQFLGWVPNEKLMQGYKEADIVVVPSFWVEAFCIVGIEAMASGRPVIGFDTGGIADWLHHNENGLLVKRGDVKALTAAIQKLIEEKALRHAFGKKGREIYEENYSATQHFTTLLKLLENIKKEA